MFEVEKSFSFEAGHILEHHDGMCAHPHGHSYQLTVVVRKDRVEDSGAKRGMVMDFQDIRAVVAPMIEQFFDHKWLNETLCVNSPTAEFIAEWVFTYLDPKIPGLFRVTISETQSSRASYYRS
jgi:6-pyruvoyltetrahydropterin/6-carboxytetrahydropterin synthase